METPDINMSKSKKFKSKDEQGKTYEIEMGLCHGSIIFKSEINNGVIINKYSNIFSFDKLKENIIFTFQENIEEIYDQLEIYINDEQVPCKINENNIIITIFTKIKKNPKIDFELKQEEIDNKKIINILVEKISVLESENKTLKKEVDILKKKVDLINEYINQQKNKKQIKFEDSLIVKEDEKQMICDWINQGQNIKTKLLYRVSRDGDGPDLFHKYCDNQGPIIIFAKLSNGFRFGGFSGISWKSEGGWVKDDKAFLFSLNNKLKFMNNNTNTTIYHGSRYGPDFGYDSNELLINCDGNKCLTGKKNFVCSRRCYNFSNKNLVGVDAEGQYNFDVEDYEVYSIQS